MEDSLLGSSEEVLGADLMEITHGGVATSQVAMALQCVVGATRGKVIAASRSLKSDKHIAVCVIEKGTNRILKELNGRSSYGPIRKTNSKGQNRNGMGTTGMPRKNRKPKKNDGKPDQQVVIAD
ncbi:hypothetical protein V6N13_033712 [Hibiscus sabdariffa]|uniref:Uncharacterized protein n=1 Tax=Hibiscus sabdariffa TaxID=183260 RepID=A0ABR2F9T7_9ROSI